ncbi:MAG: (2Fe-2S)-binding protein [Oligoflexales bacterium]|nr:(2Fe-2S)-binding protein [Oligoflexales bacterium]
MYICLCKAITERQIKELVSDKKISKLEEVQRYSPIGTGCGSCLTSLEKLLREGSYPRKIRLQIPSSSLEDGIEAIAPSPVRS